MPQPRIWRDTVWESGTKYHRARLVDRNNNVLTQGDFTGSVYQRVYDMAASNVDDPIYSNVSTIASNVYNSLQTWDDDGTGFNFEGSLSSNAVAMDGEHTYRVCYFLTHSSEGQYSVVFENKPETLLGI